MAAITLDIGGNTRQLDRDIQKTVNQVYTINLKTKGDQPLGRITGQVNEFNKSLDASNARVIAFGASAGIIFGVERAFTALVQATIEVQKSLQDINVILNTSQSNLQKFGGELFNIARNTGQSFQEVAKAATEFSRQGLGIEETLKRTSEALILSRLSGLDAAKSVESLTAAVNSFASQAVTATEVVNKFATVDAAFAVSSADLADAIARVGSSASQSGVSLNELIAIVTSAQQTTARGGAVIGNSFKTIFTRLQREKVVDLLESLGISGTDASGQVKSTIQLLQDLGKVYDTLGSQQQAYVAEQVGGVFQINILKAALADLGKEYSIYSSALNVAAGATDQAIRRNEELNKTYAAQLNALAENARQLAAAGGERLLGPSIDRLVGGTNTLLKGFTEADGQGVGAVLGKGILDGLGQFIAGPGLALIGGVLLKLFRDLAKFATGSVQQLLGLNTAATQQRDLQQSISQILAKNPQLLELALKGEQGLNQAANSLLANLQKQTVELQKQAAVAQQISKAFVAQAGVRVAGGVPVVPTGKAGKAAGFIPNFASDKLVEKYTAISLGATSSVRPHMSQGTIGGRKFVMNNQEVEFPGVGKNGDSMVLPTYGDRPRIAAAGFIPNFATTSGKKRISKETRQRSELFRKYGYLVPPGVGNGFLSGLGDEFPEKAIRVREPKLQNINSNRNELKLEKNISNKIADDAVAFTNTLKPLGRTVNKTEIEKAFQTTAGAKGAISGAVGAAFEVSISKALDYRAAQREGGDFDVRGGKNLKLVQDLFGISVPLADFKVSTSGDAKASFYDKIRKEEGLKRGNIEEQKNRDKNDAKREALTQLKSSNPEWFTKKGDKLLDPKNFPGGPEAYKQANDRLNIRTDRILSSYGGVRSGDALRSLAGRKRFAYGYIPNFSAIQTPLQNAINNEIVSGASPSQIRIDKNSKLKTPFNPEGLAVWSKKYEGSLPEGIRLAEKAGINPKTKGMTKAKGYIPNFAIEDPDVQATNFGTAAAAITAQLSTLAFAFALNGQEYKESLKQLTESTRQAAKEQLKQSRLEAKRLEQRGLGNFATTARQEASQRFRQAATPNFIAQSKAFGKANILGLSIAAPIIGETIANAVGQETQTGRVVGASASALGQIGSFAATGGMVGGKPGLVIGTAVGALLTIPTVIDSFTSEMPELSAAAKKASQDLTKFSDVSQRLLTASSSLSEFTDSGASPEKLKKVQDDFAKALSELTPIERSRIESSIKVGSLENELAKITQERIDQEKIKVQAASIRGIEERKGFLGLFPAGFDTSTSQGALDEESIRSVFKGFFSGKTPEETLENFNKAAKSGVPQLQELIKTTETFTKAQQIYSSGSLEQFRGILENIIPQGQTADQQEARSRFIKDLVEIADEGDIKALQNILQIPIKSLTRDRQQLEEGIKSAERATKSTAIFNKVKEKYTGIIDNSISSLNRTIATFNALANALDKFQVNEKSFERERNVGGLVLRKNIAETVLGPEAELTRRAALFEKIAQNEANRLDTIDQSNLDFRQNFRDNLKNVFTERAGEIATKKGQTATTIPEQAAVANEVLRAVKLFESGAIDINKILESSFKDGFVDPDQFKLALGNAFEIAEFKTPATNKILDNILSVAEEQNANLLGINQKTSQENQRAAQEFANEKILLDIRRSLQVFGGIEKFLTPPEEGIIKPLETLTKSTNVQLQAQRGFEFAKRTGAGTSFGTTAQVQNNIALGQSALNFIKQLQDLSGGSFTPDPGSELYTRAAAGLAQSFENNIKQLNDILKDPKVDQAFKSQIQATLDAIGGLGSGREIAQLQIAKETGSAFQSTLEGSLSRLQDPAIQQLRDAKLPDLADAVARSAQFTADPIVNVLSVQRGIQVGIAQQLKEIANLIKSRPSISISPAEGDVQTNSKGFIPAFNKERQAISRGVGGAKAGDRPQFVPNLNGSPAFVNSGEQLINNFMGSRQTAVLTRDMQNAMVAAKGFIPNFAPPTRIIDPNEFPKTEPVKTFQGKVVQDLTDTGRNYIVINSKTPLDESFVGKKIPFGKGKQIGEIISIDPYNRYQARVGNLNGPNGSLPPVRDSNFISKLESEQKQNLTVKQLNRKLEKYQEDYEEAFLFTIPENKIGTLADASDILRNLEREFEFNSKTYNNIESNIKYQSIKDAVKTLRNKIRSTNPRARERPQDPEFLRFLEEEKNKPRGVGPSATGTVGQQITEAIVSSAMEPVAARATQATPEDLLTDATIRAAKVTSTIGKYTGLNVSDKPFGEAGDIPKTTLLPQKNPKGSTAKTKDNKVEYYGKPGIGTVFNEAVALNQNFPNRKLKLSNIEIPQDIEKSGEIINKSGGPEAYKEKLKKLADFLEEQNKKASASQKFAEIVDLGNDSFGPGYFPGSSYSDPRAFGDVKTGSFVSSEFQYPDDPDSKGRNFWSTKYLMERASTLQDFLSRGIVSGAITDKELGLLGIPLDIASNIVAETIAIDKQLKTQKPYQPTKQKPTPPPSIPGIPRFTAPPPTVTDLPLKPAPKEPKPAAAIPGISTAIPKPVTEIPKPATGYPGGISPQTARAIVQELDANYNEAIRNQRNPQTAKAWAQTQQRYRLLYSNGQYEELDRFYKSLQKNYQRPIGQNPNKNQNQTNFAGGFIPNFAQNYISNLANLESSLSGEQARLTNIPGIGLAMINENQTPGKFPYEDHPEGKMAAIKNSMKMQKNMGVMSKGYIPNFAATDQSFIQQEAAFNNNTSAILTLNGGVTNLTSALTNFENSIANLNNTPNAQQGAGGRQAGAQPSIQTTTNAPVNVVINAESSTDIATAVGQAVQNAIPTIIEKVRLALGQKVPPSTRQSLRETTRG